MKARLVLVALGAEALPILLLIGIVALFGPREQAAAQAYAEKMGHWIGPIAGSLCCLAGAWWAARERPILQGALVGGIAAAIDLLLLVASGAAFEWLFVFSNLGRVAAGIAGGAIARTKIS